MSAAGSSYLEPIALPAGRLGLLVAIDSAAQSQCSSMPCPEARRADRSEASGTVTLNCVELGTDQLAESFAALKRIPGRCATRKSAPRI